MSLGEEDIIEAGVSGIVLAMSEGKFSREQMIRIRATFQAGVNAVDRALARGPIGVDKEQSDD